AQATSRERTLDTGSQLTVTRNCKCGKGEGTVSEKLDRRGFLGTAATAVAVSQITPVVRGEQHSAETTWSVDLKEEGYPLVIPGYRGSRPGIQLGTQLPPTAS